MSETYPPPPSFAASAHINASTWDALGLAAATPGTPEARLAYWEGAANEVEWRTRWSQVLEWTPPRSRWFVGGTLNATESCLDRHARSWRRTKAALIWEGEPGETRTITYGQLHDDVCRFAGALVKLGLGAGDRVAIYLPLVPEAAVAMLACARIGATHSVVFGGFSAEALRDRINDSQCKLVITADGGVRRGQIVRLKDTVDAALADGACPSVAKGVVVLKRTGHDVAMASGRDVWWHDVIREVAPVWQAVALDAEHPLFILYTSGTTGKPKGVVHSTGGYLVGVARTMRWTFDLKDEDIYWCSADVGWITGHSYVVYGPLAHGATVFMYEGAPTYPEPDRFWQMIERHRVSILYTAPTAIRTFMRMGDSHVTSHDLSSLRLLGSVGEPINPEAWRWYRKVVGGSRCPIVDTWWQTETGSIMMTPLPGHTSSKPGSCMKAMPGLHIDVVNKDGTASATGEQGFLVIKSPWPSMMRTVWGDDERFQQTYWTQVKDPQTGAPWYFTGDGAVKDADGDIWISGRVDDVVNVSGHRLGTAEIESALVLHPMVAEAAAVARPDDIKGQAIVVWVTLKSSAVASEALMEELKRQVATEIGSFARPEEIRWAQALPKTRSGKIMRRLLRELATQGRVTSDVTSLEDLGVIAALRGSED